MTDRNAAAAAGTPRGDGDKFEARRTSRVSKDFAKADGDVWQENLAVCESVGNKLLIRSYYLNKRTKKRVWDEPPSGASKLIPATEEMRRMANLQMQEMQLVLGVFPEDNKKGGGGGFFRRKGGKSGSSNGGPKPSNNRITYKPGSALAPKPEIVRDDTMDPDIQKAISMSLGGKYDHPSSSSEPKIRAEIWQEEEDDEVAMARALSLSAAEANGSSAAAALSHGTSDTEGRHSPRREETEEEILARVLEQSRLEAKSSEEEKREEDADLIGLGGGSSHMAHTIASNGGSRSPNRKSLSPRREDVSRQSASQKHDERKPSSLSPNREESKLSASQRRSSRNIKDAPNSDKTSESSRRKSSVSPKRASSSMRNAAAEAAAAAAAEEEEQMLQLALEASMQEADRISQAQHRIAEMSQRGRRTISIDDDLDRANRIPEPSQRGRRSICDHEASLESHRVAQLQDRLSQRGSRTISPMRDSNHSHNSLRNSNHSSASEHRRRSHEWNHPSPKQQLGHSSEHRRRSVNELLHAPIPGSSEHRRRSVDDILHAPTSDAAPSPKLEGRSEHRRRSTHELKPPPNFSSLKLDGSEHWRQSVHEINHALHHGASDSHSPRASYSPKGSPKGSPKHEAEYISSSRGARSSYSAGADYTSSSRGTRSSYSADAEYNTSSGARSSYADAEYTMSSRAARSSFSPEAAYNKSSRGARSSYSADAEYTKSSRGARSSHSAGAEYTMSSRGTRSSYSAGTPKEDMPSLITNSSSGEGMYKSGSSEKTASSERAIKGVRSSESDGLRKLEETPSNGRRQSRASSSRKLNGIHDDAGFV